MQVDKTGAGKMMRGTNGHAEQSGGVVFQREVLVGEGFGAVDAGAAGAVAVEEIAALDHEVFDLQLSEVSGGGSVE